MDIETLIDDIASQADDFLADATNRTDARTGIMEHLNADYPRLSPGDRRKVADGVMAILEEEGFFDTEPGGDWREAAGQESSDER
ncbi:MAG: hypothetical protein PHQ04_10425 [Opitutaceae bacterium]|nr:hypothetical protein [Opitutaceae bacterium]